VKEEMERGSYGEGDSLSRQEETGRIWGLIVFDEEVYESEVDVAGLAVSFLSIQAFRYNISGVLPNSMGMEEHDFIHGDGCEEQLAGVVFGSLVATTLLGAIVGKFDKKPASGTCSSFCRRAMVMLQQAAATAVSWSLLYLSKWFLSKHNDSLENPNTVTSALVSAMGISCLSICLIFTLDSIADAPFTGDAADDAIISIIKSLGVLVGFSWEQSFHLGAEVLAELTPNPAVCHICIAIFVGIMVITPWRRYILATTIRLGRMKEQKKEEQRLKDMAAHTTAVASDSCFCSGSYQVEKICLASKGYDDESQFPGGPEPSVQ